jgi:carboxyl-terminal processing protease
MLKSFRLLQVVFLLSFLGAANLSAQNLFEVSKNLEIFTDVYKQLDINYVDEIKPGELMKTGIVSMLETLDPYTNFIAESDIEDYRFMTTGQYGGVGASIIKRDNYIMISEPYKGFAADKAGIIAGDILLEINGNSTVNKSVDDVSNILKGEPGSNIKLKIKRDDKLMDFTVSRENIQVDNIPFSGMLNDHIGYIRLNSFTQNAGKDVKDAFMKLREGGKLKGLVFDLRGNGGGLLNEAVNIANIFVDKDQLIVSTKGRLASANNTYKTTLPPTDKELPLVFLVDKNSASASEILAGSMQDLDRAVVLGQRSYGKGLVQNVLPLSYNSQVKVTVAKYYIPSGRCIQAIDYSHKDADGNAGHIPDSLITAFKTLNGRVVYDGGGIVPDVNMDPQKFSGVAQNLMAKFLIFDYATKYKRDHPTIPEPKAFSITDEIYNDFLTFIKERKFDDYQTTAEKILAEVKKNTEKEKYFDHIEAEYSALKTKLAAAKQHDLEANKQEITELLKDELLTRYYYQKGKIEASLISDPEIAKAKEVLDNTEQYKVILTSTSPKSPSGKVEKN